MTHVLAFAAFLILPVIGIGIWRLDAVRRMDRDARIAVAGAAGMAIIGALLGALSILGVQWSRSSVFPLPAIAAAIGVYALRTSTGPNAPPRKTDRFAVAGILVALLVTVYGLLSARESCGDLHFFWGPKAIRFHHDGGITVAYLADKITTSQNPGYPLLLPLVYSWSLLFSRQFSWWAAVLATALFLFASVALIRGTTKDDQGAMLTAMTLAYTTAVAFAAGAAEPPLLFFETLTLVALMFVPEPRAQILLATLGLAGSVMLKLEGTTFAIAVVLALLIVRRSVKMTVMIAAPAAALIGAWLWFLRSNGIAEYYRGVGMPVYSEAIPHTLVLLLKVASFELFWLPWIIPGVLIVMSAARRAAALPLIVALLTFGAAIFYYVHVPDPTWWILSSAHRVLLTPLTALLIAAIAARSRFRATTE